MLKIFIQTVFRADNAYGGEGMMLALYFIALLILLFYGKNKRITETLAIPQLLGIGFLYVGIPFISVFVRPMEFFDGRFFWILMTTHITAAGLTLFVVNIKDKYKQLLALILLIPVIFYSGRFAISNDTYKKAQNQYRLPQEAVDITEYVLEERDEPLLVVPYTISHPFRQISTKVKLLYGENATSGRIAMAEEGRVLVCEEMEKTIPDLEHVVPLIKYFGVDYIVFDTVYTELCEDGNINIYNYPVDKRYVGDRTPHVNYSDLKPIKVVGDEDPHWDLSNYGLKYCKRFGQYVLYELEK